MSTTATATQSRSCSPALGIPAEKAFDEVAFHNPEVCSRCFCVIRRHDTFRPDAMGGVSKYAPEERLIRAFDGGKGYKVEQWNEYGYRPYHEPRTFCDDCGSQSGRAEDLTLSQRTALSFADNLVDRLHAADVCIERRTLKYLIKQFKSYECLTGYDTEIFRRAVKLGIRHARYD